MDKKVPMRRCVGCMKSKPKDDLMRIVLINDQLVVDKYGKAQMRGTYLCKNPGCIEKAVKKGGFARSLRKQISQSTLKDLEESLKNAITEVI